MGAPLVSVVTIFWNAERFLAEAIDSVHGQTRRDWELLLVDDGSTDGSTAIARAWARRQPDRVRYLEHPGHANRGMSAARNLGVRHARGRYVALLDADDAWMPPKLERDVATLEAVPEAGMVYGPALWWHGWSGRPEDAARDFVHPLGTAPDTLVRPPTLLRLILRDEGCSPCTCSVLVRRSVVEAVGGFEEGFRGLYEDQAFFAKVCLRTAVFVAGACWQRYRQHPDSACARAEAGGQAAARRRFLEWLAGHLRATGLGDAETWRVLRTELRACRHPRLHRVLGALRRGRARAGPAAAAAAGGSR
jgi:glycosyltransferase involved in cell wall biosynthesis